jgi:hypothetical protein
VLAHPAASAAPLGTHKVCLAPRSQGACCPKGGALRVVQAMLCQRVHAASLRAGGSCLGLLALLRDRSTNIARQQGALLMEKIMAM